MGRQGKITKIAAGSTACLLLNDEGCVWVWGYGILGKGPDLEQASWPRKIPPTLFGLSDFNPDVYVTDIKCGHRHFAAVNNKFELFTWGKNTSGCLGVGDEDDRYFPWKVMVGSHALDTALGVDHMILLSKTLI